MHYRLFLLAGVLIAGSAGPADAQPTTATASAPTTYNVYAQYAIDLLPGFETTTNGFEARIKLPEDVGGRWSSPRLWTPYVRPGTGTATTGLVGIHTSVTPNGKVLSWEGHNANTFDDPTACTSHAYLWNPNAPSTPWPSLAFTIPPPCSCPMPPCFPSAGGEGGNYIAHPDYEIFTPPYLCKGLGRPEISSAPQAIAYGQAFTVTRPQASTLLASATQSAGRVTLVRLSSVTHCFNMNQRFLSLTPTSISNNQINLTAPSNPNLCPPGHYILFLIDGNGTPSQASIVAINTTACANTLTLGTPTVVSDNGCDLLVRFTANGGGSGNYTWTVNGAPAGAGAASFIDLDVNAYSPTLQV